MKYLSKREQEILDVLYANGPQTANQLMERLSGGPSNSTVRTKLRVLEEKGIVSHVEQDGVFIYSPCNDRESAAGSALANVVKTFFQGSVSQTMANLITNQESKLSNEELSEIEKLIAEAKREGR